MNDDAQQDRPGVKYLTAIKGDGRVIQQLVYDAESSIFESKEAFELFEKLFVTLASAREEVTGIDQGPFERLGLLGTPDEGLPDRISLPALAALFKCDARTLRDAIDEDRLPGGRRKRGKSYWRRWVDPAELLRAFHDTLQGIAAESSHQRRLVEVLRVMGAPRCNEFETTNPFAGLSSDMSCAVAIVQVRQRYPERRWLPPEKLLALAIELPIFCSVKELAASLDLPPEDLWKIVRDAEKQPPEGRTLPGALRIGPKDGSGKIVIHRDTFIAGALAGGLGNIRPSGRSSDEPTLEDALQQRLLGDWPWVSWEKPAWHDEHTLIAQGRVDPEVSDAHHVLQVTLQRVSLSDSMAPRDSLLFKVESGSHASAEGASVDVVGARVCFKKVLAPLPYFGRRGGAEVPERRDTLSLDWSRGYLRRGLVQLLHAFVSAGQDRRRFLRAPLVWALATYIGTDVDATERRHRVHEWFEHWSSPQPGLGEDARMCKIWLSDGSSFVCRGYTGLRLREEGGRVIVEFWGRRHSAQESSTYMTQITLPPAQGE